MATFSWKSRGLNWTSSGTIYSTVQKIETKIQRKCVKAQIQSKTWALTPLTTHVCGVGPSYKVFKVVLGRRGRMVIASAYGAGGPRFESRFGENFSWKSITRSQN